MKFNKTKIRRCLSSFWLHLFDLLFSRKMWERICFVEHWIWHFALTHTEVVHSPKIPSSFSVSFRMPVSWRALWVKCTPYQWLSNKRSTSDPTKSKDIMYPRTNWTECVLPADMGRITDKTERPPVSGQCYQWHRHFKMSGKLKNWKWKIHLPSVLVPGLHLRLCETQSFGDVCSIGDTEVLLTAELALQVLQLCVREGRAPPPGLLHFCENWTQQGVTLSFAVWLVFAVRDGCSRRVDHNVQVGVAIAIRVDAGSVFAVAVSGVSGLCAQYGVRVPVLFLYALYCTEKSPFHQQIAVQCCKKKTKQCNSFCPFSLNQMKKDNCTVTAKVSLIYFSFGIFNKMVSVFLITYLDTVESEEWRNRARMDTALLPANCPPASVFPLNPTPLPVCLLSEKTACSSWL